MLVTDLFGVSEIECGDRARLVETAVNRLRISRQAVYEALGRNIGGFKVKTLQKYAEVFGGSVSIKFERRK